MGVSLPTKDCPTCKTPIPNEALYCTNCGAATPTGIGVTEAAGELRSRPAGEEGESRARLQLALGEGYEVRALLGQGGFGLVFTAFDKRLKRDLAVKVLRMELAVATAFLERFEREAMTAAQLRHPNIVPIYSIGEKDGLAYIVMPLIQGETLQALLERDGPLPLNETCRILIDAAGALAAAHKVGLIHRDIKPDNIMLEGPERRVLLMDFGIAKMLSSNDAQLTGTGVLIGTPLYMSPEQGSGDRDVDQRSDIYSLGNVAYHMLTGKPPFAGTSGADLIRQHVLTPAADIRLSRPNVPAGLASVIMRCLRKERDQRWQNADELRQALERAASLRESGFAGRSMFQVASRVRRHRISAVIMTLILVAAVGFVVLWPKLKPGPAPVPEPVSTVTVQADPVDSLLTAARGAADYARQRAVTAGAQVAQLAPGDSVRRMADSLAVQGRKAEAAVLLTSAAGIWDKAERGIRAPTDRNLAGPVRTPSAPPAESRPTASATRPPATPAVSDSQAIVAYYGELERAIQSRQLGEVKRLLPNMTTNEERTWRGIFEDDAVDDIKASYAVLNVSRRESVTYARVRYTQTVTKRGRPQDKSRLLLVTLTQGPQGWRQIREENTN
jgi:hypothetical protein